MSQFLSPTVASPNPVCDKTETKKRASRDHKRTTVRFTDSEFERIKDEAKLAGLSLPALLRLSHFKKKKLALLMSEGERHRLATELRRIGNNVNQIARRVNSGALEGWHPEFQAATTALSKLLQMVVGVYGLR